MYKKGISYKTNENIQINKKINNSKQGNPANTPSKELFTLEEINYIIQNELYWKSVQTQYLIEQLSLEKNLPSHHQDSSKVTNNIDYFDKEIRPILGIPDSTKMPNLNANVKKLLDICKDKTALMFGEQHNLQTIYFFQKNILPSLVESGFTTVVCEALPFDFDTSKYDHEREVLYNTGKVSLDGTPLLFKALINSSDFYSFKIFIEACAANKLQLYGANLTEESIQNNANSIEKIAGGIIITRQLSEKVTKIPAGTKTIFYTGYLHSNYKSIDELGIRELVDQKFGQENVLSIDITDLEFSPLDIFFDQYKINIKKFPAVVELKDSKMKKDYSIILREPKANLKSLYRFFSMAKNNGYTLSPESNLYTDQYTIKLQDQMVGKILASEEDKILGIKIHIKKTEESLISFLKKNKSSNLQYVITE